MPSVFSTLSQDNSFTIYHTINMEGQKSGRAVPVIKKILIKGGANVAKYSKIVATNGLPVTTPVGASTEVSEEDLELLMKNKSFSIQVKSGFISVNKNMKIEKGIKDLNKKDKSAPKTPKDYQGTKNEDGVEVIELPDL